MNVLEQARERLDALCAAHGVDRHERLSVRPLKPEEAIGTAEGDFVIQKGKERVIEASFREARGQAFTDAPTAWEGSLAELLVLDLTRTSRRAIFTSGLNAVLRHLSRATGTTHCRDDEPTRCGGEMAGLLRQRFGVRRYGLIGLQPAILKEMVASFSASRLQVVDRNAENIGKDRAGVLVMDGEKDLQRLVDGCDVGLATGSSVVNGTIDDILEKFTAAGKPLVFFGNTISGVAVLASLERICPFGR